MAPKWIRGRSLGLAWVAMVAMATAVALAPPATAGASVAREEADGARILHQVESGALSCDQLSAEDLDHIGEYAMGRVFGSTARHEAMNQAMTRMMGEARESRMHMIMGRRYAGCGGPALPARLDWMIGTGMTSGYGPRHGSMMSGGSPASDHHDDDLSAGWIVAGVVILIGATAGAFLAGRRTRRPS